MRENGMKKEEDESMESRIQQAMRSRLQHFKNQAESLTFEGVRRLLEKDLVLDTFALDVHKKYVKQLLEKYLSGAEDENVSKENKSEEVKKEEEVGTNEQNVIKENEEKIEEESPVKGLLSENKSENHKEKIPTENMIKKALWKRATYFRSKSEELTVAGVRRLLEEDLELKKFSLDSFKKLISKQLDEVLNSENEPPNKTGSKSDADSSHSESDNIEEKPQIKPKKKGKVEQSQGQKRKKPAPQETERPKKKKIKQTSVEKKNVKDDDESGSGSESSGGKAVKVQKEVVAPVYGKKVEHLKSIIKACGMSVGPNVYKKAKQAPEGKREAFLIKELQEVLSKEGLSANSSDKEIKDVKRRKERAKELEGIDTSNIVVGSRRRSTFNFVAPPKPIESDADADDSDSQNEDEDDDGSEATDNEDGNVPEEVHEETFESD